MCDRKGAQTLRRIAIDLDGVLAEYHGHVGVDPMDENGIGEPLPGAVEFVKTLAADGWHVVVHSKNHHPAIVNDWLLKHGFGDCVTATVLPPDATVYVDDRAVRFDGDFAPVLAFLKGDPRPWWRKGAAAEGGAGA